MAAGAQQQQPDEYKFVEVPMFWWDSYIRKQAVDAGDPDPGPLYKKVAVKKSS